MANAQAPRPLALPEEEIASLARSLEEASPQAILGWALDRFPGRLALACSFQAEDVALIAWRPPPASWGP